MCAQPPTCYWEQKPQRLSSTEAQRHITQIPLSWTAGRRPKVRPLSIKVLCSLSVHYAQGIALLHKLINLPQSQREAWTT